MPIYVAATLLLYTEPLLKSVFAGRSWAMVQHDAAERFIQPMFWAIQG